MAYGAQDCRLVIDVQNDFMPGGALAVPQGDEVVAVINRLAPAFEHVVLTQDWHPAGHASFASSHAGRAPFQSTPLPYGEQVLWPDHCVQDTPGAALHADLDIPHARLLIRKGHHAGVDSYSAFLEADRTTQTGLAGYLREHTSGAVGGELALVAQRLDLLAHVGKALVDSRLVEVGHHNWYLQFAGEQESQLGGHEAGADDAHALDEARSRLQFARGQLQQGGFSRAVATDQPDALAPDAQRQADEQPSAVRRRERDGVEGEKRRHGRLSR